MDYTDSLTEKEWLKAIDEEDEEDEEEEDDDDEVLDKRRKRGRKRRYLFVLYICVAIYVII